MVSLKKDKKNKNKNKQKKKRKEKSTSWKCTTVPLLFLQANLLICAVINQTEAKNVFFF